MRHKGRHFFRDSQEKSRKKLVNRFLGKDGKDEMAVRGMVDIGASEEVVNQRLHLVVGKYLTIRDCSRGGKAQCQNVVKRGGGNGTPGR